MSDDELRVIERTDGGPPIEGTSETFPDGTRLIRHVLPSGILTTYLHADGSLEVFHDGVLQMLVGAVERLEDDPPAPPSPPPL